MCCALLASMMTAMKSTRVRYSQETDSEHCKQQLLLTLRHVETVDHTHREESSRAVGHDVDCSIRIPDFISYQERHTQNIVAETHQTSRRGKHLGSLKKSSAVQKTLIGMHITRALKVAQKLHATMTAIKP
jgi:hypothetical protein